MPFATELLLFENSINTNLLLVKQNLISLFKLSLFSILLIYIIKIYLVNEVLVYKKLFPDNTIFKSFSGSVNVCPIVTTKVFLTLSISNAITNKKDLKYS